VAKVADSEALLKKAEQLLETRQKANIGAAAQLYTLLLQTPEAEDKWGVAVAGLGWFEHWAFIRQPKQGVICW